ncbi:MAG: tetratricopeptide repeat protein, partial [Candidatus Hodarchaeota archaeon]
FPKLYENVWPDFCLEHLLKNPRDCGEQCIDQAGRLHATFLKEGNSNAFIDINLVHKISPLSSLIPVRNWTCGFSFCEECLSPVAMSAFPKDCDHDHDEDEWCAEIYCKCGCSESWFDPDDDPAGIFCSWEDCQQNALPYVYFDIQTKQFFSFFEQHLNYLSDNPLCRCYWPYCSKAACEISDTVYDEMRTLLKSSYLSRLRETNWNSQDFPYLKDCSVHGVLARLFTHAFFYTQYRQILLLISQWAESSQDDPFEVAKILERIHSLIHSIQLPFLQLYSACLQKHPHPKIFYERGVIFFHQGRGLDSLSDIRKLIDWAEENHFEQLLTSDLYLQEGMGCSELGLYDKAIEALSKAIQKDPKNKEAYFERAVAYFEKGNFEESLKDFLVSEVRSIPIDHLQEEYAQFAYGLVRGLTSSLQESVKNFIPSMLCSLQGLGHGLWSLVTNPKEVSVELVIACRNIIDFFSNHTPVEVLQTLVPELKQLIKKRDVLTDYQRGELIGCIIGRYGTDFLLIAGISKGVKSFRDLKRANEILTLENMNQSLIKREFLEEFSYLWQKEAAQQIDQIRGTNGQAYQKLCQAIKEQKLSSHQIGKILCSSELVGKTGPIRPYRELKQLTKGMKGELQAHHIFEKRHMKALGYLDKEIANAPAQILTKGEHQALTNLLREKLPFDREYLKEEIWSAYQEVYKEYPRYLECIGHFLGEKP